MSGGYLLPKLDGGVAELERVEREAVFNVEVHERNGEERVPVQTEQCQRVDNTTANVAFVIRNKGEIHFMENNPLGVRQLALRAMAREFVHTAWSGLKWEQLKASPDDEITEAFFYEKLAQFLIPKLDGKLLYRCDKVPPHVVCIEIGIEKKRFVFPTSSPRHGLFVVGPIKTCLPEWLRTLPWLTPTHLLYFQMDLVLPGTIYKREKASARKFVSLLVEKAVLSQNLDLLEINLEAAVQYLDTAFSPQVDPDTKIRKDYLKHLIPYLLHNRCGGTIVIRGLLPLRPETSKQLDAALVEALKGKEYTFRFYKAFSQVGGNRMQNRATQCYPKPGAILTADGDALLRLGGKAKLTNADLIDTFFPRTKGPLKKDEEIVHRSLQEDKNHQTHSFYPPDVNMTDLLQVRRMIDEITEMCPLKQIEGGQKGICLTSHMEGRGRPKLGPNMYMGLAGAATGVHLDGNGPCHAWHVSCRGYSMVAMFSDKMEIESCEKLVSDLGGEIGASPQDNQVEVTFPLSGQFREWNSRYNAQGTRFLLCPGDMVVIKPGAPHLFVKADMEASLPVEHSLHECHNRIKEPLTTDERLRNRLSLGIACDGLLLGLDKDSNHQEIERLLHLEANFVVRKNLSPLCRLRTSLAYGALIEPLEAQQIVAGRSYFTCLIATIEEDMTAFGLIKLACTPSCELENPGTDAHKEKATGARKRKKTTTTHQKNREFLVFELKHAKQKDLDDEPIPCNCCQRDLPFLVFATKSRCERGRPYETHFCSNCIQRHVQSQTMEDQFIKTIYPCMAGDGEVCNGKIDGTVSAISHLMGSEFPCAADICVQTRGCDPPFHIDKLIKQVRTQLEEKSLIGPLEAFKSEFESEALRCFDLPVADRLVCNVASNL